ncbi:hypothetical protein ACWC0C_10545 [Streptomyces sp. NPDC001709]
MPSAGSWGSPTPGFATWTFLAETGFEIEGRPGDWCRAPVTLAGGEIITVAGRA